VLKFKHKFGSLRVNRDRRDVLDVVGLLFGKDDEEEKKRRRGKGAE
jgi:hypothetical protein